MRPVRHAPAVLALLLIACAGARAHAHGDAQVSAQARAGEWVSYRDAYRAMVVFEKYGGPKSLLQSQIEVQPRERGASLDGAQLVLAGKDIQLNLPLDALGRAVFPLQKAAYDENAALVLNRKGLGFSLRPRVTLAPRADGVYEGAELRAGCAQALGFARYADASLRSHGCAGVRFVFAKKGEGAAHLRRAEGQEQPLAASSGAAFAGDADQGFPVVTYRFAAGGERDQVALNNAPLAIVPVFD